MTERPHQAKDGRGHAIWPLPSGVVMGSSLRAKGIARAIRNRLGSAFTGDVAVVGDRLEISLPGDSPGQCEQIVAKIAEILEGIAGWPVLPREVEDILTITARERLKWTRDTRLNSAGTRTVKLRGRKKAVTFHVFDPRHIEEVLDRDLVAVWRAEDKALAAENRRRGAALAASTRAQKKQRTRTVSKLNDDGQVATGLNAWAAFDELGLLQTGRRRDEDES